MKNLILLVFVFISFSCREVDLSINDSLSPYDPNARINPGYGIDGILLGYSPEKVAQILGQTPIHLNWDGVNDGGEGLEYDTPEHKNLSILFSHDINNPAMVFVQSITVMKNYDGKTKEGIGIGSTFADVTKYYGVPVKSIQGNNNAHYDYYCINSRTFSINYENDIITSITISGYQERPNGMVNCK